MTVQSQRSEMREQRDPEERDAEQALQLRAAMVAAWDRSSTWRERWESSGLARDDLDGEGVLQQMSVLHKSSLPDLQRQKPPLGGLETQDVDDFPRLFMSPGPIVDPQLGEVDIGGFARGLRLAGFGPTHRVLNTFSYHMTPAGHSFESGARALGAQVLPAGFGNTEQQVQAIRHLRLDAYVGTPSFLRVLVEQGEWSFSVAAVSGEKMTEAERAALERSGGKVSQLYGTADVGYVAGECSDRSGLHVTEDLIVEVLDPATGAPINDGVGHLVVTTFSEQYPLFRFGTGDLTRVASRDICPCGRTAWRLQGVVGRLGDGVKVKGMFVYQHQVEAAARTVGLSTFQVAVTRVEGQDRMELRLLRGCTIDPGLLVEVFRTETKLRVELVLVDEVPDGSKLTDERDIWDG